MDFKYVQQQNNVTIKIAPAEYTVGAIFYLTAYRTNSIVFCPISLSY